MNTAAIYHHCGDQWCYALDEKTLHIRLRTACNDIDQVDIICGDPYEWKKKRQFPRLVQRLLSHEKNRHQRNP